MKGTITKLDKVLNLYEERALESKKRLKEMTDDLMNFVGLEVTESVMKEIKTLLHRIRREKETLHVAEGGVKALRDAISNLK